MLVEGGLIDFIIACKGFDRKLYSILVKSWNEGTCMYNNIDLTISPKIVIEAIHMPNEGIEVRREDKKIKLEFRDKYAKSFKRYFNLTKMQLGVSQECLPNPWKRLVKVLMRYVTLEGRFRVMYTYHFNFLNHFKFPYTSRFNFPLFIYNSIDFSIERFRQNIIMLPLYDFVILFVYLKALDRQIPKFKIREGGKVFENNKGISDNQVPIPLNNACGIQSFDRNSDEDDDNIPLSELFKAKGSQKRVRKVGKSSKFDLPMTKKS